MILTWSEYVEFVRTLPVITCPVCGHRFKFANGACKHYTPVTDYVPHAL